MLHIAQDCELNFVDVSKAADKVKEKPDKLLYKGNPFLNGIFTNENTFIGCGYDKVPFIFKKGATGKWEFSDHLDKGLNTVRKTLISKGSFE